MAASGSAVGARHRLLGRPSEDDHRSGSLAGRTAIVVADGHGSERCPRAREGAMLGVDVVYATLTRCPPVETAALARTAVDAWRSAVDADIDAQPDTAAGELPTDSEQRLLYGSTVIGVAADDRLLRMIQIGDGDVVLSQRDRPRARRPFPPAALGDNTDSLCHADADSRARVAEYDLADDPIDLVLVATDGFDSAFERAAWHDEVMTDLRTRLDDLSADELPDAISKWCESPAAIGGDDTTLAVLVRVGALRRDDPAPDQENPR